MAKVNPAGTALVYCGYIGGSADDSGGGIAIDSDGYAYISGSAASTEATFPVKIGPSLVYGGGTSDAFVAKVSATGADLVYCGYIGGWASDSDYWGPIAVDDWGYVYVAGHTSSTELTFPVGGGPDLSYNGGGDAFVAKIDETGSFLAFCGYIGGSRSDYASAVAVDAFGNIYVVGGTESTQATFPVTVGPYLTKGDSGIYDDVFVARIYPGVDRVARHAVGDFDGDGADEAAFDFGTEGAWLWNGGPWTQVLVGDPKLMIAADLDGDDTDEIIGALGASGLWAWKSGTWNQLSALNAELVAAGDLTADGRLELVGDFGSAGVWLWDGGAWSQIAGSDAQSLTIADPGAAAARIIASFGTAGLWAWSGGAWSQLSGGASACNVTAMRSTGPAGANLAGNFGHLGLWLWGGGSWLPISGLGPGCMTAADVDADGEEELFADFFAAGLWIWKSGVWTQTTGEHAKFLIAADTEGDGALEIAADFGRLGLWLWKSGAWSQLRSGSARNIMAADVDGDGADELVVDFLEMGIWVWDAGAWSQIGAQNPQ